METLELELVPESSAPKQLEIVVAKSELEPATAQSLLTAFEPSFTALEEWRVEAATIKVLDATRVTEMKNARNARLAIKKIRVDADNLREKLKKDSLRKGNAIQGIFNVIKFIAEPLEEYLLEQELFAERAEAARKAQLKQDREAELVPFAIDTQFIDLANMPDDQYADFLSGTKARHEAKLDAERKAEADQIAAEKKAADELAAKIKAEAEERARMQAENERLRKEAVEREAAAKIEREKEAKKHAEELAEREALAKAAWDKAAQERKEREAKDDADRQQRLKEQAATDAERKRLQAIADKAEADRLAVIHAQQAKDEEERKQRVEDAKRAKDKEHKKQVNNAALEALVATGIEAECAKACIIAIASGKIPNITIHY